MLESDYLLLLKTIFSNLQLIILLIIVDKPFFCTLLNHCKSYGYNCGLLHYSLYLRSRFQEKSTCSLTTCQRLCINSVSYLMFFTGSCSLESNSNYSGSDAGACKNSAIVKPDSPSFRGRKKFSDTYSKTSPIKQNGNSNNNAKPPQKMKNYYTAQVQQNEKWVLTWAYPAGWDNVRYSGS